MTAFQEVKQEGFAEIERRICDFWKDTDAFKKSIKQRENAPRFVFYDGPPFATGLPHYGHLLAGTIKDIIPRYWTMRGFQVARRFGWDCHGLPVEMAVEKQLDLSGKSEIESFGIPEFNEACRSIVLKYTKEWEQVVTRIGRWVDFDHDYKTMDPWYMETIWWVFKQLWEKDLIYLGHKVMPYSWRCATPLSNFEANLNYKDVQDAAITVRFAVCGQAQTYFLAWTTTPWTLPGNLALCVGKDIEYVRVQDQDVQYILAKARLDTYYKDPESVEILETLPGSKLLNMAYEPLFPYFADQREKGAFQVIAGDFVTTEDGTGIVHIAPAYGEDDAKVCEENHIPMVDGVDDEGNFKPIVSDFAGQNIKEADKHIIRMLKDQKQLVHQSTIQHSYPFCWRTDTPLIYKAVPTWFVKVSQIKEQMIANNAKIRWVPDYVGERRFANWLEDARDWAISRNRFWGTPIPVWVCDQCEKTQVPGSIEELTDLSNKQGIADIHKHFVDDLEWACPSCKEGRMRRIPEVLDCWFESGAMPYAQDHYPFENSKAFEADFPAHFIAEGLDQTRGWFYTLLVLSTALFDKPAFRNVIVNGLIIAEDGSKMSKSKRNFPDPSVVMEKLGADALRTYMINSPVVCAEPLRFEEKGVEEVVRAIILPLWNAYSFFITYANTDNWDPKTSQQVPLDQRLRIDRWIISRLQSMFSDVNREMEAYRLYNVVPALLTFIDDLTNWYIRRSRRRFWKSENDADKNAAYTTLYEVLLSLVKALAPFMPFITEEIFQNLSGHHQKGKTASVHHEDYPMANSDLQDQDLERAMATVRTVVNLGRSLRTRHKVKIRQPLCEIRVVTRDADERALAASFDALVREELNVKEVKVSSEESQLVTYSARPNLPVLGRRCGKKLKEMTPQIAALSSKALAEMFAGKTVEICGEVLGEDDLLIDRVEQDGLAVANEGSITVALNLEITSELRAEGNARELVNRIQNMRKEAGYHVSDRIHVHVECDDALWKDLECYRDYLASEVLALTFERGDAAGDATDTWDINGIEAAVTIRKAD